MKVQFMPSKKSRLSAAIAVMAGVAGMASVPQSFAQSLQLEEVIVTAQKRSESLQDVPVAVSAISGDKIASAGMRDLKDLSSYVPNVSITTTGGGGGSPARIVIRGVGSGNNAGFEQSVGMFVDGVYSGRSRQYLVPFLDVGAVEVLKGPQGSLFGKNTVAGAISVNSARPTDNLEGLITASYETEYGTPEVTGVLSGPLGENLSGRLAAKYRDEAGWADNLISGDEEPERESTAIRGSLVYLPTDTVEVYGKLEYAEMETAGGVYQVNDLSGTFRGLVPHTAVVSPLETGRLDDKVTRDSWDDEFSDTESLNGVVQVEWDIGGLELTSVTGYSDYDTSWTSDGDMGDFYLLQQNNWEEFDQVSQEFRLASPGGERLDYIVGLYLESQGLDHLQRSEFDVGGVGLPVPAISVVNDFEQDGETAAVFGQATWMFADAWSLTGGLRYSYEKKEAKLSVYSSDFGTTDENPAFDPIAFVFGGRVSGDLDEDRSTDNWSPTVNLSWDYSDEGMAYLRFSRGYKSGGYNVLLADTTSGNFEFDDEQVDSIELGTKMTMLDGAATLNIAAFYSEFSDRQFSTFTDNGFVVGNAAQSTSTGFEVEGRMMASQYLSLGLSLAYLNSEFDEFLAACSIEQQIADDPEAAGCVDGAQDLEGETTIWAPEWSATFVSSFNYPVGDALEFRADLDIIYNDDIALDQSLDSNTWQDSHTKVNARVALASADDTWELAVTGKNLTDETTSATSAGVPFFTGSYFRAVMDPRTVAVEATYRF